MTLMKQVPEGYQLFPETFSGIVTVVKVNFDFAVALATEGGEVIHDGGIILLLRIEKGMTRGASIRIAKGVDGSGICRQPVVNRLAGGRHIGIITEGLEVIANTNDQMACTGNVMRAGQNGSQIAGEPLINGFKHGEFFTTAGERRKDLP
jgi:hypothetical protein